MVTEKEKIKSVPDEVRERINSMMNKKKSDLKTINEKLKELETEKQAAESELKQATENMDLSAFETAKKKIHITSTASEMYQKRYDQISKQEYVTEEESDQVIKSIMKYESDISEEFENAIQKPLKIIKDLQEEYTANIAKAENTIQTWTQNIHANYKHPSTIYADGTNRSDKPVPVRVGVYRGSDVAQVIEQLVKPGGRLFDYIGK